MARKEIIHSQEKDNKQLKSLAAWRKVVNAGFAIGLTSFALIFVCMIVTGNNVPNILVYILMVLFVVPLVFAGIGKFIVDFKQKNIAARYTQDVLERMMDQLEYYNQDGSVSFDYIKEELGLPHYDEITDTGDHVKGILDGKPVEFSEFTLKEEKTETDSDGEEKTSWYTVFSGLILLSRHGRELNGDFTLTQYTRYFRGLKTESVDFNKAFSITAEDGHDVFYVLTPQYMENLMKLAKEMGNIFAFRFRKDGTLIVVVSGMDLFEVEHADSAMALTEKIENDINKIRHILETLI